MWAKRAFKNCEKLVAQKKKKGGASFGWQTRIGQPIQMNMRKKRNRENCGLKIASGNAGSHYAQRGWSLKMLNHYTGWRGWGNTMYMQWRPEGWGECYEFVHTLMSSWKDGLNLLKGHAHRSDHHLSGNHLPKYLHRSWKQPGLFFSAKAVWIEHGHTVKNSSGTEGTYFGSWLKLGGWGET